jgi:dihydroflavonol-4-reductase
VKVLVTGATGFVGFHVAKTIKEQSLDVRALVRETSNVKPLESLGVELIPGDLRDYQSVLNALDGCRRVYHVAADYRLWVPDPKIMYDTNVTGTQHVMRGALELGVDKVVYTSTVGVWSGSATGESVNENKPSTYAEMVGHYKKSKFLAENEVLRFIKKGLPAVIVNPSTPIGPMDRKPTPTGKLIVDFLNGKIPAYLDSGLNFVDVTDVALGHWLASCHGRIGQKYILGHKNMTLKKIFETLARITGQKAPRIRLPYVPVLLAAFMNEMVSRITHRHPIIPATGVKMARKYMFFDSSKAVNELKMPQSSIENAMKEATQWFVRNGYVSNPTIVV